MSKLAELFEGLELSEETKTKIEESFELAVEEKVAEKEIALEEKYTEASAEYSEYLLSEMTDKTEQYIAEEIIPNLEKYADYAVNEFIKEQEEGLERQSKVQIAESLLTGFGDLIKQHNVKLPEGEGIVEALEEKVAKSNSRVDELLTRNVRVEKQLVEMKKEKILSAITDKITESEKEKFGIMASEVVYVNESQYQEAVEVLFESYHPNVDAINEKRNPVEAKTTGNSYLDKLFEKVKS